MEQVAGFWNRLAVIARELQSEKVQKCVKKVIEELSEERRLKVWTSNGFKKDAVAKCAKWVSYGILCKEYIKGITVTRTELYACLQELILPTEAPEKLQDLLAHQQKLTEEKFVKSAATTSGE